VSDRYRWLYQGNPHGKGEVWLALDKTTEEIVACTAIFPKKLRINGEMVLGCVGGDTYVDPRWRRKGIAAALHRTTANEMKDVGIQLHYGFPLAENFQAKLKAGAIHPGYFFTASLPLSSRPLLKKAKLDAFVPESLQMVMDKAMLRFRGLLTSTSDKSVYNARRISAFDGSFETLENEIASSFPICCVRGLPYLKWRFIENPMKQCTVLGLEDMDGHLCGYAALEKVGRAIVVGDLFVPPKVERVNAILRMVVEFAVSQDAKSIVIMMNPEELLGKRLLSFGFRLLRESRFPMIVLTDRADSGLDEIRNWHITAADLDV
jgi:GNAT superfamily N-acetyltransferase